MRFVTFILLSIFGFATYAGTAGAAAPSKVIRIFNNTPNKLFAVLETSMNSTDEWLQGVFRVTDTGRDRYAHTELYRVYINPVNGIDPGQYAAIRVPFYSQLARTPDPSKPNQYIDWWNGGRVYLYDEKSYVTRALQKDLTRVVRPLTAGVTCVQGSQCEHPHIFASTVGLPANDPMQLTEYTFADVVTALGPPYKVDVTHVDYDISYVDHVYLPVAMAPLGNKEIGYIGSVQSVAAARNILNKFLTTWKGWPRYVGEPPYPNPRIPGAYNALIGVDVTKPGAAIIDMRDLYYNCTGPAAVCAKIEIVDNLFRKNYASYLKLNCDHRRLTQGLLLEHVYGWVQFNEDCGPNAASANVLPKTPGVNYQQTVDAYKDLQYWRTGQFNPYVQLIHGRDYLNMPGSYAFSIDDDVGNMNEVGGGLVITVGGPRGLPNRKPFDHTKVIYVNLGAPTGGLPKWDSYGVCTNKPDHTLGPNQLGFSLVTVDYPCRVSVTDAKGRLYQLTVRNEPPDPVIRCANVSNPTWCNSSNVSTDSKKWYINTPPPDR